MTTSRGTPFRANEAADNGREEAIHNYCRSFKEPELRAAATKYIDLLIEKYGPVVDGYPSWHPFTSKPKSEEGMTRECYPITVPYGFEGLDHTIYFRDAFVTAPYGDAQRVIDSTWALKNPYLFPEEITDVQLYFYNTTPVLVRCEDIPKEEDGTISKRFALGRMLAKELPAWEWATCGESWEDMRRYILGAPCGSRSSLFVNQETGKALREAFDLLNRHELFGPVRK